MATSQIQMGFTLAIGLLTCLSSPSLAEVYTWTDDSGAIHFTDRLENVPQEARPAAEESLVTPLLEKPDTSTR